MRKLCAVLVSTVLSLSGCVGRPKLADDPFAGLSKASPAMRESSVAVVLTENTKAARAFATSRKAKTTMNFDGEAVLSEVAETFRRNFKTATFVETEYDSRIKQADVVATLDIQRSWRRRIPIWKVMPLALFGILAIPIMTQLRMFEFPTEMTVVFRAQGGSPIATFSEKVVKSNKGPSDMHHQFRNGLRDCRIAVERQMISSRELEAYLRKLHPDAAPAPLMAQLETTAAAKTWSSAVDKPGYKHEEDDRLVAVVVGVGKYASVPEAAFAERDAAAVRDHLFALGYAPRNVALLVGEQASKASIEKYVESWIPSRLKKDSRVVVYFAGHGTPDLSSGRPHLLPYDGDPRYLAETAYPVARLYEQLGKLKAPVLVALDAGFSGSGGRSVLPAGTRPLVAKIDETRPPGGLTILTASAPDEQAGADETEGHGLFTYWLLRGLNERQGVPDVKPLYEFAKPRVQDAARSATRDQTPQLLGRGLASLR